MNMVAHISRNWIISSKVRNLAKILSFWWFLILLDLFKELYIFTILNYLKILTHIALIIFANFFWVVLNSYLPSWYIWKMHIKNLLTLKLFNLMIIDEVSLHDILYLLLDFIIDNTLGLQKNNINSNSSILKSKLKSIRQKV